MLKIVLILIASITSIADGSGIVRRQLSLLRMGKRNDEVRGHQLDLSSDFSQIAAEQDQEERVARLIPPLPRLGKTMEGLIDTKSDRIFVILPLTGTQKQYEGAYRQRRSINSEDPYEGIHELGESRNDLKVESSVFLKQLAERAPLPRLGERAPLPRLGERAPLPRLGERAPLPRLGERAPLPRLGERAPLPRLGERAPLPRLGERAPLPRLGERAPLPRLGERAPLPRLGERAPLPRLGERAEDTDEAVAPLPRIGLFSRASALPRIGFYQRTSRLPRIGLFDRSPLPRIGMRQVDSAPLAEELENFHHIQEIDTSEERKDKESTKHHDLKDGTSSKRSLNLLRMGR